MKYIDYRLSWYLPFILYWHIFISMGLLQFQVLGINHYFFLPFVLSVTVYCLSKVGSLLRFTPGGNSCTCVRTTSSWPVAVSSPSFVPAWVLPKLRTHAE